MQERGIFPQDSTIQRLEKVNRHPNSSEVDIALAQDVLHGRIELPHMVRMLNDFRWSEFDASQRGDSISLWIVRVGGTTAGVEAARNIMSVRNPAQAQLITAAGELLEDNTWMMDLTRSYNVEALSALTRVALIRDDSEVLEGIEQRIGKLDSVTRQYSGDVRDIENLIRVYRADKQSSGADKGRYFWNKSVRSVYTFSSPEEVAEELDREMRRHIDVSEALMMDDDIRRMAPVRPTATADRAFWLTMRLGELKATDELKEVLDHEYAGRQTKREAVRQLVVAGEREFLSDYAKEKLVLPVDLFNMHPDLVSSFQGDLSDEQNDVAFYISAILGKSTK